MLTEKEIQIEDTGRKLKFKIRKMPAMQAFDFGAKFGITICGAVGSGVPEALTKLSENWIKGVGSLDYEKTRPLILELLACCYRIDAGVEQRCTEDCIDGFIEDPRTIFHLAYASFQHSFGFFTDWAKSLSRGE